MTQQRTLKRHAIALADRFVQSVTAPLAPVALLAALAASTSHAQPPFAPPLPMNNRTPFTQTLIAPTAPDHTLAAKRLQLGLHTDISSHSLIESDGNTRLELDGETLTVGLDVQYRASDRWLLKLEAPFVLHSGGFLDRFIDRWHRITGLPEGERPRQSTDHLLFGYGDDNQLLITDAQQAALGDIQLSAAYRLREVAPPVLDRSGGWQTNLWSQLTIKLPSGRPESLTGSGATDVALSLHLIRQQLDVVRPWALSADAYLIVTGEGELIDRQRDAQWQLGVKLSRNWSAKLTPEVQIRYRSAVYDNPLEALGSGSLGIDAGVLLRGSRGYWRAGLSEDIKVDSAPDVGFYVQYFRYAGRR